MTLLFCWIPLGGASSKKISKTFVRTMLMSMVFECCECATNIGVGCTAMRSHVILDHHYVNVAVFYRCDCGAESPDKEFFVKHLIEEHAVLIQDIIENEEDINLISMIVRSRCGERVLVRSVLKNKDRALPDKDMRSPKRACIAAPKQRQFLAELDGDAGDDVRVVALPSLKLEDDGRVAAQALLALSGVAIP